MHFSINLITYVFALKMWQRTVIDYACYSGEELRIFTRIESRIAALSILKQTQTCNYPILIITVTFCMPSTALLYLPRSLKQQSVSYIYIILFS